MMKKCVVIVLIIVPLTVPILLPGLGINDVYSRIDITTGRVRTTWNLWFVPLWRQTKDSELTKALKPEDFGNAKPQWRVVYHASLPIPLWHFHTTYHGAIHQVNQLDRLWHVIETEQILTGSALDDVKRKIAKDVLLLWQASGHYFVAGTYLRCLEDMVYRMKQADEQEEQINELKAQLDALLTLNVVETKMVGGKTVKIFYTPDGSPMKR